MATGCDDGPDDLVIYTSVDDPIARPIIEKFEADTGISVRMISDSEASKSVGLAERLRAERDRPKADVWWGNEPFYTIGLAEDDLLRPMQAPEDIHAAFVGKDNLWVGNGLRARVIALNPKISYHPEPTTFAELADEPNLVMARPTAGTTGGHVAFIYATLGQDAADAYFKKIHDNNVLLVGGNGPAAQSVTDGLYTVAVTDNDDVAHRTNVRAVIPTDTLYIPTTVALVAGRENPDAAKLAAYLASPEVEQALADANFTIGSVRDKTPPQGPTYEDVAALLRPAIARATGLLEGRDPADLPDVK